MICACRYIDSNQQVFIERLREAVAIRSVSGWPETRGEVTQMIQYAAKVIFIYLNLIAGSMPMNTMVNEPISII